MKQLTCEMCGSTDLLKQDGVFVCQTCGTKYSVEEAKKMMIDGVVEVSGTVKVDDSEKITTYMSMAENAYSASNTAEAEAYCNRVIEIDPSNADAWLLKGKAAGWQSSLANSRIDEAIVCFKKAISFSSEEAVDQTMELLGEELEVSATPKKFVTHAAFEELQKISTALVKLSGDNFIKWPDKDEQIQTNNIFVDCVTKLQKFSLDVEYDTTLGEILKPLVELVNTISVTAYISTTLKDYNDEQFPNRYEWERYYTRADNSISLLDQAQKAVGLAPVGLENTAIQILDNMITIHKKVIDSCPWKSDYIDYLRDRPGGYESVVATIRACGNIPDPANNRYWHRDYSLTSAAKAARNRIIEALQNLKKSYQDLIKKQEEEEQRKRNEAYWADHAEEKNYLGSERNTLQAQLRQLELQIAPFEIEITKWNKKKQEKTPAMKEKQTLEKQAKELIERQVNLGFFNIIEKKSIQTQIDEISARLPSINQSIENEKKEQIRLCNEKIREIEQQAKPIKDKIADAEKRISKINAELTKNR